MFTYSMNEETIAKGIASLTRRNGSWNKDAHKVCVSILAAWVKGKSPQRPVMLATKLVKEAGGYRAQALVNWFTVYAGFEWDSGQFIYTKTTIDTDTVKAAKAEPFYVLTKAAEPKPFDFIEQLTKLVEKAEKRAEKPKEGDVIPEDILNHVSAIISGK